MLFRPMAGTGTEVGVCQISPGNWLLEDGRANPIGCFVLDSLLNHAPRSLSDSFLKYQSGLPHPCLEGRGEKRRREEMRGEEERGEPSTRLERSGSVCEHSVA